MITGRIHLKNILFLIILLFSSCFKDEDVKLELPPRLPGDPQLHLMQNSIYNSQAYFNLETNETTAMNDKMAWDLGFEASDTGWHIILNAAKRMQVAGLAIDFENITSQSAVESDQWLWDKSDGNLDSTGVGNWIDFSADIPIPIRTYVVDRGFDEFGNRVGYQKFQMLSFDGSQYQIRFAEMNGDNENTVWVEKDHSVNFVAFSFNNGGESMILEPAKNNWHLLLSQYTGITYDLLGDPYPYFVQGVLINRHNGVRAMVDTSLLFNEFDYDLVQTYEYSSSMDTIGHLWKDVYVDMETLESLYICDTTRNHIIKTAEGTYYKLRFLDFYNGDGLKGYTSFEYQKL